VALRVGAFVGALVLVFAAAALAGNAFDPVANEDEKKMGAMAGTTHAGDEAAGAHAEPAAAVPGLGTEQDGYRLVPEQDRFRSGATTLRFAVVDEAGEAVRDFEVEHRRPMHLIVVRRDFEDFQHLHPRPHADGSWSATADLARAGTYRMFADFATGGTPVTLGADLFVAGGFEPRPLPAPAESVDAGDGYEVLIDADDSGGTEFTVFREGRKIESVRPYLGADGHLVALREGDLAFLHTHPEGEPGGPVEFRVEYPSPGRYRLYFQFKHGGEVRTAAFTREVGDERH
jgi:hypothetical protein